MRYAVFGCGDHHWASTYQAIPKLLDEKLAALARSRICPRGEADAADDFDGQFHSWYASFWTQVARALGLEIAQAAAKTARNPYRVELVNTQVDLPVVAAYGASRLTVSVNRELQSRAGANGNDRSTRHIELALPEGVSYHAGDHLGVLPRNRSRAVQRVLDHFKLGGEAQVVIKRDDAGKSHLPLDQPIRIAELIAAYVEIQDTAARTRSGSSPSRPPALPRRPGSRPWPATTRSAPRATARRCSASTYRY